MKLHLSQNLPFEPIAAAWNARSRDLFFMNDQLAREQVMQINAKVLSNRKPPYSLVGGLYDALSDTDGAMVSMTNEEAAEAASLFEVNEGIDIHPAAAIATASLMKAVREDQVQPDEVVMLNITGGGEERFRKEAGALHYLKPALVIRTEVTFAELEDEIRRII